MRVINHNWSAMKRHLYPQSVAEINRHSVLSGDKCRQDSTCGTSSGSHHNWHRNVSVPRENASVETTVAEGGQNSVAGLWGRTLGES